MKIKNYLLVLCIAVTISCSHDKNVLVNYNHPEIQYWGRVDTTNGDGANLYWSGTSITINFEGETIQGIFKDSNGDNYYNIFVDGNEPFILRPDTLQQNLTLASGLSDGEHSVKIFKRTEFNRGTTTFYGFQIEGAAKVLPKPEQKKRKIEFYGNSITAGYAVEDSSGKDSPDSTFTNNYLSYSAITARHFDAQYHCICKSGIGVVLSWFPYEMPDIYDQLDPNNESDKWDFAKYTPDIVVVNLFQNDSYLLNFPNGREYKANFGENAPSDEFIISAYQQFISDLRGHYPKAKIICALGTMDASKPGSKWPEIIEKALANIDDEDIYSHIMPYKGTPGHPSINEQEIMAKSLIQFIDDHIDW